MVTDDQGYAGYTILQPGKKLDISALIKAKRFKDKGNKAGAVAACKRLESAGLGVLHELGKSRGTSMVQIKFLHIPYIANGLFTEVYV